MELELPEDCARKYRAVRQIASGGFGAVYEAVHRDLGSRAAIKVLLAFDEPDAAVRFGDEARLTASLSHPRIIRVLDFGAAARAPWIAFEYAEGRSVRALCDAGAVGLEQAVAIVTQVAEALDEAHGRGVLHRDIKPDNVLEVSAGAYKVVDFGIAKWAQAAVRTAHGTILGTPAYIAPEQIRGEPASPASDLYALGVMFFELVTGRPPFAGASAAALLESHLHRVPPRASQVAPAVPAAVDRVIARLLEKDPAGRHGSAAALIADLARGARGEQRAVAPARRSWAPLVVAGLLGVGVLAWPSRPPAPVVASPPGLDEGTAEVRMKQVEARITPLDERNTRRRRAFDTLATWQVELNPPPEPTPEWIAHLTAVQRQLEDLRREASGDLAEIRELGAEYGAVCAGATGTPYRVGLYVSLLALQFRVVCQEHRFRHFARATEVGVRARRRPVDVARTISGPNPGDFRAGAETLEALFAQVDATVARLGAGRHLIIEATLAWEINTTGKEFSGARKELVSVAGLEACEARWLAAPGGRLGGLLRDFWTLRCGRVEHGQRAFPRPGDPVMERLRPWFQEILGGLDENNRVGVQMIIDTFKLK